MDTRRDPRSRERQDAPRDVSTDTVPVELVDLQSVGTANRGSKRGAMIAIGAVAILGFAALASALQPPAPKPSPSAPVAVIGSLSPTIPLASPTESGPPATTIPTSPPAWAWSENDLFPNDQVSLGDGGLWSVGGNILALVERVLPNGGFSSWNIARLSQVRAWELIEAPRSIDRFFAGTVIDDELWFVAQLNGIGVDDITWQLVGTRDGSAWETLGPGSGLGRLDDVSFLGRVGGRWVVASSLYLDEEQTQRVDALRSSEDGVIWEDAETADLSGAQQYARGASRGDLGVLMGYDGGETPNDSFVLSSTDGMNWHLADLAAPNFETGAAACNASTCIVTGYLYETEAPPVAWATTDGSAWTASPTSASVDGEYESITTLTPYADGFMGMAYNGRRIWISPDGLEWRSIEVIPKVDQEAIAGLGTSGDAVVALVERFSGNPPAYWRGSLSKLAAAP